MCHTHHAPPSTSSPSNPFWTYSCPLVEPPLLHMLLHFTPDTPLHTTCTFDKFSSHMFFPPYAFPWFPWLPHFHVPSVDPSSSFTAVYKQVEYMLYCSLNINLDHMSSFSPLHSSYLILNKFIEMMKESKVRMGFES